MSMLREPPGQRAYAPLNDDAGTLMMVGEGKIALPSDMKINDLGVQFQEAESTPVPGVPLPGGGTLFTEDGKLKYMGTKGTVTTLAIA